MLAWHTKQEKVTSMAFAEDLIQAKPLLFFGKYQRLTLNHFYHFFETLEYIFQSD